MYKATINITVEVESETPFTSGEFSATMADGLYDYAEDLGAEYVGVICVHPIQWEKDFEVGDTIKANQLKDLPAGTLVSCKVSKSKYTALKDVSSFKMVFAYPHFGGIVNFDSAQQMGRTYEIVYLPEEK